MSDPIPTGCPPLDDLLGGGLPRGTVTQVYGPPAAGKTNLGLSAAIETAVAGETSYYIDTEGLSVDRFEQLARARSDDVEGLSSRIVIAEALDFEQFHVACLSGGNGQGKSALLDAITWALWGEARKASDARKPDEDLLRIGTREMTCCSNFGLS